LFEDFFSASLQVQKRVQQVGSIWRETLRSYPACTVSSPQAPYSPRHVGDQKRLGLIVAGVEVTPAFWYPHGDAATAFFRNLGIGGDSLRDFARTFAAG
jgi:hypothetical protein